MEIHRPTDTDDTTRDLTATLIEILADAVTESDTKVFEASETGDCMIRLRNGRLFRLALLEVL